jgi:hypothetical protein
MRDKELVEYIKVRKEYPRNFYDNTNYYVFVYPLAGALIGLTIIKFGKTPFELLSGILLLLFAIMVSIFFLNKLTTSRRFHTINPKSDLTIDKAHELVNSNFKLLRSTVNYELNMINAHEPMTFFSYGSEITLLFDRDKVFVNVRTGPFFKPFSLFRDKRKLQKIITLLT